MDHPQEDLPIESEIIRSQFTFWNNIVERLGETGDPGGSAEMEYDFTVDRTSEPESQFTADEIHIRRFPMGFQINEYTNLPPGFRETPNDEQWLGFSINPKDPYRSKIGEFSEEYRGETFGPHYVTEGLDIFLSNKGRVFQEDFWSNTLVNNVYGKQPPNASWLKSTPDETSLIHFEEDPTDEIPQRIPLEGKNLERLTFLAREIASKTNTQGGTNLV